MTSQQLQHIMDLPFHYVLFRFYTTAHNLWIYPCNDDSLQGLIQCKEDFLVHEEGEHIFKQHLNNNNLNTFNWE